MFGFVGDAIGMGGSMLGLGGDNGGGAGLDSQPLVEAVTATVSDNNNDVLLTMSNNSKDTALAQIQSQEFAMTQAEATQDMQHAATLELSLQTFDTKLQTSKMGFMQNMKVEEDRHVEKMAANAAQFRQMTSSLEDSTADVPLPDTW